MQVYELEVTKHGADRLRDSYYIIPGGENIVFYRRLEREELKVVDFDYMAWFFTPNGGDVCIRLCDGRTSKSVLERVSKLSE
jgi:hypothetical protein